MLRQISEIICGTPPPAKRRARCFIRRASQPGTDALGAMPRSPDATWWLSPGKRPARPSACDSLNPLLLSISSSPSLASWPDCFSSFSVFWDPYGTLVPCLSSSNQLLYPCLSSSNLLLYPCLSSSNLLLYPAPSFPSSPSPQTAQAWLTCGKKRRR